MNLIPHGDLAPGQLIIHGTADPLRVLDVERTAGRTCVWTWNVAQECAEAALCFDGAAMVQLHDAPEG